MASVVPHLSKKWLYHTNCCQCFSQKGSFVPFFRHFLWSTFDKVLAFGAKKSTLVLGFSVLIFQISVHGHHLLLIRITRL